MSADLERRSVVVTGASSGIGLATVRMLLGRGVRVYGAVRHEDDADRLAREIGPAFVPLVLDLRDGEAINAAAAEVRAELGGRTLLGLVNNAAVVLPGPVLFQPFDEIQEQIETDLLGTIRITRAFAPLLGADWTLKGEPGRIVMMSSTGGKLGQPFLSGYLASKTGLEAFTETLRRELQLFGIDVAVIGPACASTPIWDKARPARGRYAGTPYWSSFDSALDKLTTVSRRQGVSPETLADSVWHALSARRPRRRYTPARHPILEGAIARATSTRLLDRLFDLALGLRPSRR